MTGVPDASLDLLGLLLPMIEPHPELVASKSPTSRQVCEAAALMGFLPEDEDRLFRPAVRAEAP